MISAVTGFVAGCVHVLSGPDHLAALAPLAINRPHRAWVAGLRWGVGHSLGVGIIGLFSLWLREVVPLNLISSWSERMVGVLLIGIGLWGLRKAFCTNVHIHEHSHGSGRHVHIHVHSQGHTHSTPGTHKHSHAAFGIGTLHGLAGGSHLLGILPVLAFPSNVQAGGYLIAYGLGTVATMAFFSSAVGLFTSRLMLGGPATYRTLLCICSLVALAIGGSWLAP